MNVKKCFIYVLALFGISISFAFIFPSSAFANFEEDETIVNEDLSANDEMPLLTSEVPTPVYVTQEVYQENMNNLFNLLDSKLPLYYIANNIDYTVFDGGESIPITNFESFLGINSVFDDVFDWASFDDEYVFLQTYYFNQYDNFSKGYYRISNYDNDIAFIILNDGLGTYDIIPLLEFDYYDVYIPFESSFVFVSFEKYDFVVQSLDLSLSVGGRAIDNMSNKLDSLQTDIYLLKNAVAVIGFTLLFSVMYPLLTSITHKFMGRKD